MAARLAALPGSYALASLASAVVARLLPLSRAEAATTAMLLFFALFAMLILWAFSTRNIARLWLWFAGSGALLTMILILSIHASGRA